ncbi:S8 family serine peptidase [Ideonella sp. A 288]|uniref:S8 family peptidase n=1 Tax=Ideonella sp. A 288 TaxID=1962181 RepID=UPI000B4A8161|nr:S8 family serine peptidase [Ideonella sp. A 288]
MKSFIASFSGIAAAIAACLTIVTMPAGAAQPGDVVPGEVLLKLTSTAALGPLLQKYELSLLSSFGARPIYRVKVIGGAVVADKLAALGLEPTVLLAEENRLTQSPEATKIRPWAIGTETDYVSQWAWPSLRLSFAHRIATGKGVRVAVLDTGVDRTHPAIAARLAPGQDFVDGDTDPTEGGTSLDVSFGHGTHVAGIIARMAPGATIMPIRVLDPQGLGNVWTLSEALLYAIDPDGNPDTDDGAHVVNLSLGSPVRTRLLDAVANLVSCGLPDAADPVTDMTDPGYNADRQRCTRSAGAVIVAAAGNDGSRDLRIYPAAEGAYGLISVAASTSASKLADFSNSGDWISLVAPGDGITSAVPGGYGSWSGTSMSAPIVAGTAALLRQISPTMEPKKLARCLDRTSAAMVGTKIRSVSPYRAVLTLSQYPDCNP